ncbi:predicted protein [Phaeodactylum tricornutum CCAP 1055/1]|jgi:uncharacterized protein (DUF952 family)|uniref:Uncharacterized protein n=2 Tax=Phaeodactylum tricornutum TaxID=2850 RepID=B7FWY5_PHATC|nr:predicted protein [Phaeodactylum tricornutum CCAP 1055/1]EEC49284.1 predicted protein [Phaeodactylum tricornutum CCAP 1055/1]|eukprot:XP_002179461.1 predicted protein [Phaeodactylum tricornutum CCAP 1055/1]
MPKLVGKSTRVVEHDGLTIDELAGNVASKEDTLSVARVFVANPTSEPWLTLDYDEWLCVLKGKVELHSETNGQTSVLTVLAGETVFVSKGERFRPVFPVGDTEYIPVCIPAFKPERCIREEDGCSDVAANLRMLHGTVSSESSAPADMSTDHVDQLYHMCQKSLWDEAFASGKAYFPPTFEADGYFTHATSVPSRLIQTANHFYTATIGDWICLELSNEALKNVGITTRYEEPKPVGELDTGKDWTDWRCPHIFGGIPTQLSGFVCKTYPMKRNEQGKFLSIDGLVDEE